MLTHVDQRQFGRQLLDQVIAAGYPDCEVYISRASILSLELRDRTATLPLYGGEQGYQLRVMKNGRLVTVFSDVFTDKAFESILPMLAGRGLAVPEGFVLSQPSAPFEAQSMFDATILDVPLSDKWRLVHELCDQADAQNFFVKQIPLGQYRQMLETVTYLGSSGAEMSFESSGLQLLVHVNGRKGEQSSSGVGISLATRWDRLSVSEAAEMAAETARIKLHPLEFELDRYPVVFRPYAGALLVFLAWSLFGDPQSARFDPNFRLVDRPGLPHAPGSSPFDCEGTPCQDTRLVDKGRVCGLLTDRLGGARLGLNSTGSARLSGVSGLRSISVSNLLLEPQDAFSEFPDSPFLEILLLEVPADLRSEPGRLKLQATGIIHNQEGSLPCGSFPVYLPVDGFPGPILSVGSDLRFYPLGSGGIFGAPSFTCMDVTLQ